MSRVITIAALKPRSESELWTLLADAHRDLARSRPGTPDRRNALASLESIERVLNWRVSGRCS